MICGNEVSMTVIKMARWERKGMGMALQRQNRENLVVFTSTYTKPELRIQSGHWGK